MKSLASSIFTTIVLFVAAHLNAQHVQTTTYIEQTHISPKLGTSVGYSFADHIEVGAFFQRATEQQEAEPGRLLKSENEFYGAYFAYPVFSRRMADIKFNVRTGVTNGENFVITPSLMATFKPLKNINIGGGIGTRSFKPSYMATIRINLNGGDNNNQGFLAFNN